MTAQPHPLRCQTCKNTDCDYWEDSPTMASSHQTGIGWMASPGVITFAVGCASHSDTRRQQPRPPCEECIWSGPLDNRVLKPQQPDALAELLTKAKEEYRTACDKSAGQWHGCDPTSGPHARVKAIRECIAALSQRTEQEARK